jgi:hypothetical protein
VGVQFSEDLLDGRKSLKNFNFSTTDVSNKGLDSTWLGTPFPSMVTVTVIILSPANFTIFRGQYKNYSGNFGTLKQRVTAELRSVLSHEQLANLADRFCYPIEVCLKVTYQVDIAKVPYQSCFPHGVVLFRGSSPLTTVVQFILNSPTGTIQVNLNWCEKKDGFLPAGESPPNLSNTRSRLAELLNLHVEVETQPRPKWVYRQDPMEPKCRRSFAQWTFPVTPKKLMEVMEKFPHLSFH